LCATAADAAEGGGAVRAGGGVVGDPLRAGGGVVGDPLRAGGGVVGAPVRAGGGVVGELVRGNAPVGFARVGPLGGAAPAASPFVSRILSSSALRSAEPGGGGGTVRGFLRPGCAGALGSGAMTAGVAAFGVADGD
jgi:hypothetical protein